MSKHSAKGRSWDRIRAEQIARQPYCALCFTTYDLTVDHVIARANGGTNAPDNLLTLCRRCNAKKGISPLVRRAFINF